MAYKWNFYQDPRKYWRWTRTTPNGKVVGASAEGYKSKQACEEKARRNGWKG